MTHRQATILFWTIALAYGATWTLLPFFLEPNFRFDIIEMFLVGKEGVVSTSKLPALNSAILEIVYQALGRSTVAPYLLAQVCYLTTAWFVWRIGRDYLSPLQALFGALAYFGYWGYFYKSLCYCHSVVLAPFWAATVFFALRAMCRDRRRDWIALGLAIGIGVYVKFTILLLVAAILLFTLLSSQARKYWRRPGPYVTTLVALTVALPLLVWIVQSNFTNLSYPDGEYGLKETMSNRFYALFNDALIAPPYLIISFLVLLHPLLGFRLRLRRLEGDRLLARNFLLGAFCLPWAIAAAACFVSAIPIQARNFMQFLIPISPLLLLAFETRETPRRIRAAWIFFALTMLLYMGGYLGHVYNSYHWAKREVFYMYPGRELAEKAEEIWHARYPQPLPYTAGGWWQAGNVAIYGRDRATVHCMNSSQTTEPDFPLGNWSTDRHVNKYGGLVLWSMNPKNWRGDPEATSRKNVLERFPAAEILPPIRLPSKSRRGKDFVVGIALVPPNPELEAPPFEPAPWHFFHPPEKVEMGRAGE